MSANVQLEKNRNLCGLVRDGAFQWSALGHDPLPLRLFPNFGLHCCTALGVYSQDYDVSLPLVLLELKTSTSLLSVLPAPLAKLHFDRLFVVVHEQLDASECQHFTCSSRREINVIVHPFVFADLESFDSDIDVQRVAECGVFTYGGDGGAKTVSACHQDIDELYRGMSIDCVQKRCVSMHNMSFSPHNCQLRLDDDVGDVPHRFFAYVRAPDARAALSLHIVPVNAEMAKRMVDAVVAADTLDSLLAKLGALLDNETNQLLEQMVAASP
jgi:hypothetical protein